VVTPRGEVRPLLNPPAHPSGGGGWPKGERGAIATPLDRLDPQRISRGSGTGSAVTHRQDPRVGLVRHSGFGPQPRCVHCAAPGASRQTLAEHVPRLLAQRDLTPLPRLAGVRAGASVPRSQRPEHALAPLARRDSSFLPREAKVRAGGPSVCRPRRVAGPARLARRDHRIAPPATSSAAAAGGPRRLRAAQV
jgi:hypothetical protein